jgi:mono/diheme cytochrome c family protein
MVIQVTKIGMYIFLLLMLVACNDDAHNHPSLESGQQLFDYHCAGCHHKNGNGNFLKGIPANIGTGLVEWQLVHKMKQGESNSKMPVFKSMSKQEAAKIAEYITSKSH